MHCACYSLDEICQLHSRLRHPRGQDIANDNQLGINFLRDARKLLNHQVNSTLPARDVSPSSISRVQTLAALLSCIMDHAMSASLRGDDTDDGGETLLQ